MAFPADVIRPSDVMIHDVNILQTKTEVLPVSAAVFGFWPPAPVVSTSYQDAGRAELDQK
ncbi:hypothetical protein P0Y35_01120 [Kiritimatiellaeota bacterium B1221]|nr:hypothetical protein [Kiritimatiellaeota bacterium B1221]